MNNISKQIIICSSVFVLGALAIIGVCISAESNKEQQEVSNIENNSNVDTLNVKTFYYNNHKYIKFTSGKESGYVHDPDCPCQNKTPNKF